MPDIRIVAETEAMRSRVATLVAQAFGRADEALLVEKLHNAGAISLSLVAVAGDAPVGHVAFQDLRLEPGSPGERYVSLAPVSVAPPYQRRGIGSAIIQAGLTIIGDQGADAAFVLGDPAYYRRFGFDAVAAALFEAPWTGPHFMAKRLSNRTLSSHGRLIYPPAFFESAV